MSDSNVSEKLVEGITNIIKKTIIFEKTERMEYLIYGFFISSSIFSLFTIFNSYQLNNIDEKQNDMDEKITSIKNVIKDYTHMPKVYYQILFDGYNVLYKMSRQQINTDKRIDNINERIDKIIALLEDKKDE